MQILSLPVPEIPNWLLYTALGSVALYIYGTWPYRYWKQRGIHGPKMLPFIGGLYALVKCGDFRVYMMDGMKRYGKVYGTFVMRSPVLVVADTEMVKQICIKRADIFTDRSTFGLDFSPLNKSVLALKGQEWKRVRNLLTPTFSSGKIKAMYPLVEQCAQQLCDSLLKAPDQTVELKKYFTNFTMDVVACTMFGLQINSQVDENSEFKRHTDEVFNSSLWNWKLWANLLFPSIAKPLFERFRISMFRMETLNFFQDVISSALRDREASVDCDKYNDFLASMVTARREAEKQGAKGLTEEEVLAQSLVFFLAGLETTSSSMQFLAYFLAWNPDCQDRVYREVFDAKQKNGGVLSYECVQGLTYLGQCFDEALRMCPPVMMTDRICTETTVVNGYEIEKGVMVRIPIYSLANDPDVWADPDTFNPDRFTQDSGDTMDSTYRIPFGLGPRSCIGLRLAQMEVRKAFADMLLRIELRPTPGTMPFDKLQFSISPDLATKEPIRLLALPRSEDI